MNDSLHIPVLLDDVLSLLAPQKGERYLDLTAGYGGHAREVLARTSAYATSILVDRDEFALGHLSDVADKGVNLVHDDYLSAAKDLSDRKEAFDCILMDIGVSSPQLDLAERGFSFMNDGPLDMRMDQSKGESASDLIDRISTLELTRIIREYGEEPGSRATKIARAITANRPYTGTVQLADVITGAFGGARGKIHPATKTFQALRLAVNGELIQLRETLPLLPNLLNEGGRVAIISFHSLEDRLVKTYFKEQAEAGYEASLQILTKKPVEGLYNDHNPRARSAKLRAAVKI